jgi:hypothetical protein
MVAYSEALCTALSGFLLFTTKGVELGVSWLLFAVFLGVFGSYETIYYFTTESHVFMSSLLYIVAGWMGLVLGLILIDGLIDIITFNMIAIASYVLLSSAAQLRPAELWFVSKIGVSTLIGVLGSMVMHRWPTKALHISAVSLGAFLVASGVQLIVDKSESLILTVTQCSEIMWMTENTHCYPMFLLWPTLLFAGTSVRIARSQEEAPGGVTQPLLEEGFALDEWRPRLPTGLHGLQKSLKILLFKILPGCLRVCYNFLSMAESATTAIH